MPWFETNLRRFCQCALVATLALFGRLTAEANDGCTQCEGCPYHVDGQCITNPGQWGYYRTNWRRWPGDFPRAEAGVRHVPASVPEVDIPDPVHEDESQPRPQRGGSAFPGSSAIPDQRSPILPDNLHRDDWQKDPFQDDPVPDIPGVDEELLNDLESPQTSVPRRSKRQSQLADRRGRRRQKRQVRSSSGGPVLTPVKPANVSTEPSPTVVQASATVATDSAGHSADDNPLRDSTKLTARTSLPNSRSRGNPLR